MTTAEDVGAEDPTAWNDLFVSDVNERPVGPAHTDRPTWAVYEDGMYLGACLPSRTAASHCGRPAQKGAGARS
ncbi:hypothetical protein ACFYZJ_32290 [Streptomyces sp. NPDC001848]|uniref:hypothetical protein n=1 Tax=Streptomyces sp. NPDC001848 TaxID=3364618 RepID=UPI00367E0458